jgi:phosphatidate cytidylyltransferase
LSVSEQSPRPSGRHRGRHAAVDDDDDVDVTAEVVIDEDDRPTGRHSLLALQELLDADNITADQPKLEATPSATASSAATSTVTILDELSRPVEHAPATPSRAGRNLPAAIGIGLLLGGIILASLFGYRPSFVVLVVLAVGYGIYELVTALGTVGAHPPLPPLLVGGVAMDVAAWYRGPNGLVVVTFITLCAALIWRLGEGSSGYLRDITGAVLIALYLPLLAGFAVLLAHPSDGAARVILFVATVVCSDTGGYFAGVLFGRHPLAPVVSRAKTWEGFAGSLVACALCASLIVHFTFHHAWWQGALFGAAIAVTATIGDLGESLIKRDLGLKDMGRLLPGHGGLMDRLDSLLPCAAVAYLVLTAILLN